MDPVLGFLAGARASRIDFDITGELSWFPYNFVDGHVYDL